MLNRFAYTTWNSTKIATGLKATSWQRRNHLSGQCGKSAPFFGAPSPTFFFYVFAANGEPSLRNVTQTTQSLPRLPLLWHVGETTAGRSAPWAPEAPPYASQAPSFHMQCAPMYFRGAPLSYGGAPMTFIPAPLLHVDAPIGLSSPLFACRHHYGPHRRPVDITCAPLPHVGAPLASEV